MTRNQSTDAPKQTAEKHLRRVGREQRKSTDTTGDHKDRHTSGTPPRFSGNGSSARGDLKRK